MLLVQPRSSDCDNKERDPLVLKASISHWQKQQKYTWFILCNYQLTYIINQITVIRCRSKRKCQFLSTNWLPLIWHTCKPNFIFFNIKTLWRSIGVWPFLRIIAKHGLEWSINKVKQSTSNYKWFSRKPTSVCQGKLKISTEWKNYRNGTQISNLNTEDETPFTVYSLICPALLFWSIDTILMVGTPPISWMQVQGIKDCWSRNAIHIII